MPRRRRERPITALREVPSTLAISAAVLPAACMVSSFLSRAVVQLVCMFFFVAIVAPPSAGAAPCGAHRSAAAARPRARRPPACRRGQRPRHGGHCAHFFDLRHTNRAGAGRGLVVWPLGPGSARAGGRGAPFAYRGARWAGTREGLLGRDWERG